MNTGLVASNDDSVIQWIEQYSKYFCVCSEKKVWRTDTKHKKTTTSLTTLSQLWAKKGVGGGFTKKSTSLIILLIKKTNNKKNPLWVISLSQKYAVQKKKRKKTQSSPVKKKKTGVLKPEALNNLSRNLKSHININNTLLWIPWA